MRPRPSGKWHDTRVTTRLTAHRIKGKEFTLPRLLLGDNAVEGNPKYDAILNEGEASIAVCRLAPQDYHRFHSPVSGTVVDITDIPGQLYTVNPQAVNEGKLLYGGR